MPRNGSPEDPHHSDATQDPTQYANYGGSSSQAYSDYGHDQPGYGQPDYRQPAPAASTWHRKPAVLIGLGVLTAVVLAFLVYAVVKFVGVDTSGPALVPGTSATSAVTTTGADTGANTGASTATSSAPSTAGTTETVTETQTPTTSAAPTTTAPPTSSSTVTSTTTSVTTSTSTVTVTTSRAPWTLPTLFPRPKEDGQ